MWEPKRVRFLLNAEGGLQPALYKKRNPPCDVGDCTEITLLTFTKSFNNKYWNNTNCFVSLCYVVEVCCYRGDVGCLYPVPNHIRTYHLFI